MIIAWYIHKTKPIACENDANEMMTLINIMQVHINTKFVLHLCLKCRYKQMVSIH